MIPSTYKENLLQNARYEMKKIGGKVIVKGTGNKRHVELRGKDGFGVVSVWYPEEARINDAEVWDLKEAVVFMKSLSNRHDYEADTHKNGIHQRRGRTL